MNLITFAEQQWVHLVWVAVLLVALLAWLDVRTRTTLTAFLTSSMQLRLVKATTLTRRVLRLLLIFIALLSGVLALMRPQTPAGSETVASHSITADIIIALDVSRSMLAEDATPNRLERAKAEISEFVERVGQHRVGLIAFAGRAVVKSPLTSDQGFFRLMLRDVNTRTVSRGGTRIGDALRKAVAAFGATSGAPRLLLLISDGEDHDSYPLEALQQVVDAGVRVVAIGFGSETGSEITVTDPMTGARSVVTDSSGRVVRSRLDGELLREIALKTEGIYVPAGTAALDLDSIVSAHIEPLVHDAASRVIRRDPIEHYRWFVLAALLALVASVWAGAPRTVENRA